MARPSASQEILIEEWKEARRSVGRFDEYLLNLRRYGFTLATILIGGDAYLSITQDVLPWAKAGAAAAVMLLIFALFLLDHHVKTLQSTALCRAAELEKHLGLVPEGTGEGSKDVADKSLSELRQDVSGSWQITHGGTPIYFLFLAVTGGVGSTAVLTTGPGESVSLGPLVAVAFVCIVLCGVTPVYNWWATRKLGDLLTPKGVKRQLAGVFTQLGQILQGKDKQT